MKCLNTFTVLLLSGLQKVCNAPLGYDQLQVIIHDPYETDQPSSSPVRDTLKLNSVIDDVLDDFSPSYALTVSWPSSHESAQLGNDIPVSSVSSRPAFTFFSLPSSAVFPAPRISKNTTFTLALTDPDATSRTNPKWSEFCHWIVTNVTVTSTARHTASVGEKLDELVVYKPPTPPPKTGRHRYVFVLLVGDAEAARELEAPGDRKHWGYGKVRHGVRDWAGENGLEVVGANFFFAQNEKQ